MHPFFSHVLSAFIALITFVVTWTIGEKIIRSDFLLGIVVWPLCLFIWWLVYRISRGESKIISSVMDVKERVQSGVDEQDAHFYGKAEEEVENGAIDKGLWSQALVVANGDESKRKVEYIKLRVNQLKRLAKS